MIKYPKNSQYTMLVTSLPSHKNDLFDEQQLPISRIQLNKRLALLEPDDAADLLSIEELLHWSHIKSNINQNFVDNTLASLASIDNQFISNIVIWRLELRIILVALRMRHQGQTQAPTKKIFGFDYWYFIISKYWHLPDFGLGKQLPWLAEANKLLLANESLKLEKLLFSVVWEHYHRQSLGHYFNFEAVIIYVLRWDIVYRWTENNSETAIQRFDDLVESSLQQSISL